jgi:hypothetical protein
VFDRRVSSLGPLADFAGGVVRVEHSTSAYLNGYYPGETLAIEPEPLVRNTLQAHGHVARLFTHPGVRARNIRGKNLGVGGGLTAFGMGLIFRQQANGAHGRPFIRYTLPALEMRMMLQVGTATPLARCASNAPITACAVHSPALALSL